MPYVNLLQVKFQKLAFVGDPEDRFSGDEAHKIYVQYLSIIGTLVDNLLRLQAWPVSQIIFWWKLESES